MTEKPGHAAVPRRSQRVGDNLATEQQYLENKQKYEQKL